MKLPWLLALAAVLAHTATVFVRSLIDEPAPLQDRGFNDFTTE